MKAYDAFREKRGNDPAITVMDFDQCDPIPRAAFEADPALLCGGDMRRAAEFDREWRRLVMVARSLAEKTQQPSVRALDR